MKGLPAIWRSTNGAVLEPPLANKSFAAGFDLLARRCIDHIVIIGGDLLMQALRRVRQRVAVFVDRAPLDRHAVPDRGDGLF